MNKLNIQIYDITQSRINNINKLYESQKRYSGPINYVRANLLNNGTPNITGDLPRVPQYFIVL